MGRPGNSPSLRPWNDPELLKLDEQMEARLREGRSEGQKLGSGKGKGRYSDAALRMAQDERAAVDSIYAARLARRRERIVRKLLGDGS